MHKIFNFNKAHFIFFFFLLVVLLVSYLRSYYLIQSYEDLRFLLRVLCFRSYISVVDPF